jgi:uncharacterized protein
MTGMNSEPIEIAISDHHAVSGLLQVPTRATACYVLAHGAGAGMTHSFLEAMASELAERHIATLRFQFPFMERGSKRPDPAPVAQKAVRAAAAAALRFLPKLPLIAGGRSFLGFPLHLAKKPSTERARHLGAVTVPMLFIQGTRDALADLSHLSSVSEQLGTRATLHLIEQADHSFHVPARSGRSDEEVRGEIADALAHWIGGVI